MRAASLPADGPSYYVYTTWGLAIPLKQWLLKTCWWLNNVFILCAATNAYLQGTRRISDSLAWDQIINVERIITKWCVVRQNCVKYIMNWYSCCLPASSSIFAPKQKQSRQHFVRCDLRAEYLHLRSLMSLYSGLEWCTVFLVSRNAPSLLTCYPSTLPLCCRARLREHRGCFVEYITLPDSLIFYCAGKYTPDRGPKISEA